MLTFTVVVATATHDDLANGLTAARYHRVDVLADTDTDATLIACQIAACHGGMPTCATITDIRA